MNIFLRNILVLYNVYFCSCNSLNKVQFICIAMTWTTIESALGTNQSHFNKIFNIYIVFQRLTKSNSEIKVQKKT